MGASLDQIMEFTCRRAPLANSRTDLSITWGNHPRHTLGNTRRGACLFLGERAISHRIIQMHDEFEMPRVIMQKIHLRGRRLHICVLIAHIHLWVATAWYCWPFPAQHLITTVSRTILFEFDSSCWVSGAYIWPWITRVMRWRDFYTVWK